jgi:Bacterial Ig domain
VIFSFSAKGRLVVLRGRMLVLLAIATTMAGSRTMLGDGSANAPSGTPQFSNILSGYAVRPDWKVAGVDYYVGTPSGTVLKDPSTISMAGVSVGWFKPIVTVSGSDVTLDGYDFGSRGGWQIDIVKNANNVTIENSSFKVGANNLMPIQAYDGGTINVLNNTFDGGASSGSGVNAMVFTGTGGARIEYNRFTNFPNDGIDITHDGNYVVRYNVFDTMGAGDYHTDAIQTYFSAVSSLSIQYNTMYQPPGMSNGGINSFVRIGDQKGNVVHSPVAACNTIIMASTQAKTANIFQWDADGKATLINPQIHDNYIDPTGVLYAIVSPSMLDPTGVVNPVTYNNFDLKIGKPMLFGPYNNRFSGVPSKPPAAAVITGESVVGADQTALSGTSAPGIRIDIYDQNGSLLGAVKADAGGKWVFPMRQPPNSDHSFTVRTTDAYANSSPPSPVANK